MKKGKKLVMPRLHRAMLKKLAKQPFVMATTKTLPYLEHLPPSTVIRAHKIVNADMGPAYKQHSPIRYLPGTEVSEPHYNSDNMVSCGAGLNVGTVEWMKFCYAAEVKHIADSALLAVVEFKRDDVCAFPIGHMADRYILHGKFRLRRLKVLSVSVMDVPEYRTELRNRHVVVTRLDKRIFETKARKVA